MSTFATAIRPSENTGHAATTSGDRVDSPQLPVRSYLDEEVFDAEMRHLFARGPGYVGHELMVPEQGDYHVLGWKNDGHALVRSTEGPCGIKLLSNVCRHRQAVMLKGRGNTPNIICPLHRWTYDLKGSLLGAPHFPETPCVHLRDEPLQSWNGLLFNSPRDVNADMNGLQIPELDFSGYLFDRTEIHECSYNWKTFIEVFLEDYHVEPFHPGLGNFVSCSDLSWQFNDRFNVQSVSVANDMKRAGTRAYEKWQQALRKYYGERNTQPAKGAVWLTIYPNIMIEWYPHVLIISTLIPRSAQSTTNVVEFYYPEDIALFEHELVEGQQAAYMETAFEDDEIGLRMDAGRKALFAEGRNETGPYQSPMEDGMRHFHQFMRREMGPLYR